MIKGILNKEALKLGGLQPWHWIIVIAVFMLLFGSKKLPESAQSLGRSIRIFKSEIREMHLHPNENTTSKNQNQVSQTGHEIKKDSSFE